jgi:Fe2+ or Zn2+ uptake regulation protein
MGDIILTHAQKLILSQFTNHTKGLTIKDICENPETEVDMPFNEVYTILQELTSLKLLRIGKAGDTAKWFITYAGIKAGGVAGSPWP